MADVLFATREDLVRYTSVGGNVDTDKLIPHIKVAQDLHIQPLLGTKLYDKLQTDITGSTLAGNYLTLMNDYIQPTLIHMAVAEFISFHAYEISNGGVLRHQSENASTPSKEEIDSLRQRQMDVANHYRRRMIDHLSYFNERYPELNQGQEDGMSPSYSRRSNRWNIY